MNLYALYAAIRDGVAQDAELATWATAQFSRSVTVFAGLAGSRMPYTDDDAPFVVLGDPADRRGMEDSTIDYEVSGWIGLSCGQMREDSLANVIEPAGVEQIAQALTLVATPSRPCCPTTSSLRPSRPPPTPWAPAMRSTGISRLS